MVNARQNRVVNDEANSENRQQSRGQLIWQVLVFQVKLVADGFRDLLLVPISLLAALIGLVAGGDRPAFLFEKVLHLGRQSERWINLFGHHQTGTADDLLEPLRDRVAAEADRHPSLNKAGQKLNASLDKVNERIAPSRSSSEHQPTSPEAAKTTSDPTEN